MSKQKQINGLLDRVFRHADVKREYRALLGAPDGELYYYDASDEIVKDYVYATISSGDDNGSELAIRVVRNKKVQPVWGLPVILVYSRSGELEVKEEDADLSTSFSNGRNFNTPEHGWAHGKWGADPVFIDPYQVLYATARPTEPTPDSNVYVEPFVYRFNGTNKLWAGGNLSLSSQIAALSAGEHQLIIVCLNMDTNALVAVEGATTIPYPPDTDQMAFTNTDIIAVDTLNYFKCAAVRIYDAQTQIRRHDFLSDLKFANTDQLADVDLAHGGTGSDLSAAGPGVLQQRTNGAVVTSLKYNFTATAAPTVNDDSGDGYDEGSWWFDLTNDIGWLCIDATLGAALWLKMAGAMLVDTKDTVAAITGDDGDEAFLTDTLEHAIFQGGAWRVSAFPYAPSIMPSMGVHRDSNWMGYGLDYIANKAIINSWIGSNSDLINGGVRVNISEDPDTFEIYLRDTWQNIIYDLTTEYGDFRHTPVGEQIYVWSGCSVILSLSGLPVIQQYQVSMGAYSMPLLESGGTF